MTRICFPDISRPRSKFAKDLWAANRLILPPRGIKVTELARMEKDGAPVSAKRVRALLKEKKFAEASRLVPDTTAKILSANGMLE